MTNIERRDAGLPYIADEEVYAQYRRCRALLDRLNRAPFDDLELHKALAAELLGKSENATINPPFYCDYGFNIHAGKNLYINYNCTILDVCRVTIGDDCLMAPHAAIYTAGHPLHPAARAAGWEYGAPVTIGNHVWIGGGAMILPGVTVGNCCVIAAGSVVARNLPAWSLAAGNPCRVIRKITEDDLAFYFKDKRFSDEELEEITRARAGLGL